MRDFETLLVQIEDKTALVTINREDKLNALNSQTLKELSSLLDDLASNDAVRGIILTGAGVKAFVAGADILAFQGLSSTEASDLSEQGQVNVMNKIANFKKPVLAAINGFALGGGLELALACHIRVAVENAKMGLPEVSLGIIPGYGGTQRLTQLVGRGKALEMILTADMITAEEALRWGLVNHVVVYEELLSTCRALLAKIYSRSAVAIAHAIAAVNEGIRNPENGYKKEIELFGASFATAEAKEGIQAFIEKRKPKF